MKRSFPLLLLSLLAILPISLAVLGGYLPANGTVLTLLTWSFVFTGIFVFQILQARETSRAAAAREQAFLKGVGEAVFSIDKTGRITLWNAGVAHLTGWKDSEVLGKRYQEVINLIREPEGLDCSSLVEEALQSGSVRKLEPGLSLVRRDDGKISVTGNAVPFFDGEEQVNGVLVVFGDTKKASAASEQKKQTDEQQSVLEKVQHQLLQQERLRALGQMASGIAHDFNNALAPILGYSELMLDMSHILDDKDKAISYLRTINTAAKDAANIVRHLREFYRPREKDESFASVDINHLIKQVIILTQPKWKTQALAKGINIRVSAEVNRVPFVEGNETELREIFTNFIFNAVDALPKGGEVLFRTSPQAERVLVEIEDTGLGMTEEVMRHCFEPFFTTKGEGGTGLGLAMAYGIIQRHGGKIEVKSEVGRGTTFSVFLQACKGEGSGENSEKNAVLNSILKILYVEDEESVREVIGAYLKRDGHTIDAVANGVEGLKKFMSNYYDLVITDKAMPAMSGAQLAAAIKRESPDKPIILLSGTDGDEAELGLVDVILLKPITLDVLRRTIHDLLYKSRLKKSSSAAL